jgi:hypothetical protein
LLGLVNQAPLRNIIAEAPVQSRKRTPGGQAPGRQRINWHCNKQR